jgi:3-phosphoshikimate 1-carboxyvinyltransferase (EC 2.5.1.19)
MADVGSTLTLKSLQEKSLQGDCVIAEIGKKFGIRSTFDASQNAVLLEKTDYKASASFEWDFIKCPDIAQTVAVMCAATGISGLFTGLETLRIKETDRIAALSTELGKVNAFFNPLPKKFYF